MAPTDPNLTIQNLLNNNWNSSNTNGTKPKIHTGKHREDESDPQVAVQPDGESPLGGGDTGYAAMDSTGGGGIQELNGIIACECYDNYGRITNVKDSIYKMKEEIARIVMANQLNNDDLRVISPGAYQRPILADRDPVKLQGTQPVAYIRERRP